jgi:hypothetical protein
VLGRHLEEVLGYLEVCPDRPELDFIAKAAPQFLQRPDTRENCDFLFWKSVRRQILDREALLIGF